MNRYLSEYETGRTRPVSDISHCDNQRLGCNYDEFVLPVRRSDLLRVVTYEGKRRVSKADKFDRCADHCRSPAATCIGPSLAGIWHPCHVRSYVTTSSITSAQI
jgi:hypothetical protein